MRIHPSLSPVPHLMPFSPQHTLIAAPSSGLIDSEVMVGPKDAIPLLYRGTGLITDADNPLVLPVLRAPSTAYCYSPTQSISDYPHATGM